VLNLHIHLFFLGRTRFRVHGAFCQKCGKFPRHRFGNPPGAKEQLLKAIFWLLTGQQKFYQSNPVISLAENFLQKKKVTDSKFNGRTKIKPISIQTASSPSNRFSIPLPGTLFLPRLSPPSPHTHSTNTTRRCTALLPPPKIPAKIEL
jgi:hypothetical protein